MPTDDPVQSQPLDDFQYQECQIAVFYSQLNSKKRQFIMQNAAFLFYALS